MMYITKLKLYSKLINKCFLTNDVSNIFFKHLQKVIQQN